MSKAQSKVISPYENPFLTNRADTLWKRLDKKNKPITKEAIQKRVKGIKGKKS